MNDAATTALPARQVADGVENKVIACLSDAPGDVGHVTRLRGGVFLSEETADAHVFAGL